MTHIVTKPRYRIKAGRSSDGVLVKTNEGEFRPGPYYLPVTGGWLSAEAGEETNWWQRGHNIQATGSVSALVEACLAAYSQTAAQCPGDHWHLQSNGGRERVTTSALSRILKHPNEYQTISDFMLNAVRHLYLDGNTYALALRNSRFEITELHLMNSRQCRPFVAETGDVFYALHGNPVIAKEFVYPLYVPSRDVLHIRLNVSDYDMLRGESPLIAAARDVASVNAIAAQQLAFYMNQARPSTVLSTDMVLDKDQVTALRDRWNEQSRGFGQGGTPILTAGLKPLQLATNAVDAQLAEILKGNEQRIALAFRVPLQILGMSGGSNFNTTEALMQSWLSSSLGFCLNHIEEAFGKLFGLNGYPDDYVEFNTNALLRSAFKDRIDGLVRAVQGGVFAPDEARATEGYPKVPGGFGEEPRVQQQLVPLSAAAAIPAAPTSSAPPSAPSGAAAASKESTDVIRRRLRSSHARQQSSAV